MKNPPQRQNVRLKGYDYSCNGAYFVTVCVMDRLQLLGSIPEDDARSGPLLSECGQIVDNEIAALSHAYKGVTVDKYVIMPNHVHMIIRISMMDAQTEPSPTISRMIQQWKSAVSKKLGRSIWQKSFYDHVIRSEMDYRIKWEYIDTNPIRWTEDDYYPGRD